LFGCHFFPKLAALRKKFFPGGLNRFSQANRPYVQADSLKQIFSRDYYRVLPVSSEVKLAAAVRFSTPSFG